MEGEMKRVKIDTNAFVYPMPVVLVGTLVDDRPNFLAVGWITRVNYQPAMLAIALAKGHYSSRGIHSAKAFSVNVPGIDLVEQTDYCGLVSGREEDKSRWFQVVRGPVTGAPMIEECPLCMECKLVQTVEFPTNTLFVGEIVGAYADEKYLSGGVPDIQKMKPFTLSMPDNKYWRVGDKVGEAWSVGRNLKRRPT
jgi:flavin reductase (DIM6/NTAB) family NADH-FMN oxidoreductase RutF